MILTRLQTTLLIKLLCCLAALCSFSNSIVAQTTVDLELDMSIDNQVLVATQEYNLTLNLKNNSANLATDLIIKIPIPEGMATGNINANHGDYSTWSSNWRIDSLTAGTTATLNIELGATNENGLKIFFGEVVRVNQKDSDSTPDNNNTLVANEDDEALIVLAANEDIASVHLIKFPENGQLFPRDIDTNMGLAKVAGTVDDNSNFDAVRVNIFKNEAVINTIDQPLEYINGVANFDLDAPIFAERNTYSIILYGLNGNTETYLQRVGNLVAGDVYLISGQSNAEALAVQHPSDEDDFLRSYNGRYGWDELKFSYPGQWGARMAKFLSDEHNLPIAIFNTAQGGQMITYFLPDDESNNYVNAYERLRIAGVNDGIRGIFWFQGESDGYTTTSQDYKSSFEQLNNAWIADYNPDHFFLFQIRYQSCSAPNPDIFESHRQLANEMDNLSIMSTTNAQHDSCHFYYEDGYQVLGNRMARLVSRELYDNDLTLVDAPNINIAYISEENELVLEMQNEDDTLMIIGTPWADFVLGTSNLTVTNGYVDGHKLIMELSGNPEMIDKVSYLGHPGIAADWITNMAGVGMITFYDLALSDPPAKSADLSLSMSVDTSLVSNDDLFTISLSIKNSSTDKAYDIVIENTLSDGLVYETSSDEFDRNTGLWSIDSLIKDELRIIDVTIRVDNINSDFTNFAQVIAANPDDPDSTPNNNNTQIPNEDDEAAVSMTFDNNSTGINFAPTTDSDNFNVEKVYPNPSINQLNILLDAKESDLIDVQIHDLRGQLHQQNNHTLHTGSNLIQLDLDQLPTGVYTIALQNNAHQHILRFVKAK